MYYLQNIVIGGCATTATTYKIGDPGKYFVKGLIDDPVNLFLVYLFTIDYNINSGTFGVFKMDFTPSSLKYVYTAFSMSSGSTFSVNSIIRTSLTDPNDFYFAGKAQSLTDGTNTKTFLTATGYVMKGKTSDTTQNCLNFISGYSLSL